MPEEQPKKPNYYPLSCDKPEQLKPTIAELETILERDGADSIEIMPNGEIRARKLHCPICGYKWVASAPPEVKRTSNGDTELKTAVWKGESG